MNTEDVLFPLTCTTHLLCAGHYAKAEALLAQAISILCLSFFFEVRRSSYIISRLSTSMLSSMIHGRERTAVPL